jgi:hypothetical protein
VAIASLSRLSRDQMSRPAMAVNAARLAAGLIACLPLPADAPARSLHSFAASGPVASGRPSPLAAGGAAFTPVNAARFVAGNLGVNTHLGDPYSDTAYWDHAAVRSAMSYLGVSNIRDSVASGELPRIETLAGYGVHFDITRDMNWISDAEFKSRIDQIQSAHPGAITSIEGQNEVNGWITTSQAIAEQTWMHDALRADPLFAKVPIYNFSLNSYNLGDYQALGDLSRIADAMPLHYYYGAGPVAGGWDTELGFAHAVTPKAATHVFTEIGVSTAPPGTSWGVNQTVQAKDALNVVMDAARSNARVFFYELVDESHNNTPAENNFGLFNGDWTPKPAATALHNLTTILTSGADPDAAPDSFSAAITGLPSWGSYSVVFEKTAATHDIVVWHEPPLYNSTTSTEISNPASNVTVSLGSTYASIDVYDPLVGTAPIQRLTSASAVTVSVVDHPLIIEVSTRAVQRSSSE